MKSTKNLLITGVILATTLFASTQMFAKLTPEQVDKVITLNRAERNDIYTNMDLFAALVINGKDKDAEKVQKSIAVANKRSQAYLSLMLTTKIYSPSQFEDAIERIQSIRV